MYSTEQKIVKLAKGLYPRGRAFKAALNSRLEKLHAALAVSTNTVFNASTSGLFDSMLPDNNNFTADDATAMERWLGIYSAPGTSLADRKLAIIVKLNFPGTTAPRQHYLFIQDELQDAGFDVYLYENRFLAGSPPAYETNTPRQVLGAVGVAAISGFFQSGQAQYGQLSTVEPVSKIVNYIEEEEDAVFNVGANLRSTFFVSGATIDTFAEVPTVRKTEFRQLLLQLKPVQSVGFLFVTYT